MKAKVEKSVSRERVTIESESRKSERRENKSKASAW